jgi:aminoglycoside phosphotransferase (APT) family kinase protein/membrane protein YqaA with SNARE-associated domain
MRVDNFISSGGYLAVLFLTMLESACIPIPSEVTLGLAGALASGATFAGATHHHLQLGWVIVVGIVGSVIGSYVAYAVGRTGGRALVDRLGKYVLLTHADLDRAEAWFARRGDSVVLFGRIVPVVRTFISLPAGMAEMDLVRFGVFTAIGCAVWVTALTCAGWALGASWNVSGFVGPATFELIAGGRSNLTYRVIDGHGTAYALRRPPLGLVLSTAHDMGREHRIIAALWKTAVPVAPALAYCPDTSVNGMPFYVMGYVDGLVVANQKEAAAALTVEQRRRAGECLIDVLVDLHAVDFDQVALGDLGRREEYVGRQLRRWQRQLHSVTTAAPPLLDDVHDRLVACVPPQGSATIVHGDFRLGNTILNDQGHVSAVLDWELCTLGDPLADLGYVVATWTRTPDGINLDGRPIEGFPTVDEVVARYASGSGRDVSGISYYVAFNLWRWACIIHGVANRYASGVMGPLEGGELDRYGEMVVEAGESALSMLVKTGGG